MGPWTFVIAAIGSAIGLGNFWRFPYLCFKHGGGLFFVPYLICLFLLGLPMLMLEFSLGQKFQRGDIGVFRGIHPRLAGIGMASVFCAYAITFYYTVVIGWACVYFFVGFKSPLPWSAQYVSPRNDPSYTGAKFFTSLMFDSDIHNPSCDGTYITEKYFWHDVIKLMNDDCEKYDTSEYIGGGDEQTGVFAWQAWLGSLLSWVIVYFCIFKGVQSSSYVVWITVPLPCVFVFCLVLRGLTLENSDAGIRMYLLGEGGDGKTGKEKLAGAEIWTEACAQIFFSIGVCMGIMTSYASYNPVDNPIIGPSCKVAFGNSLFSFFAGFAVFSTVGYLQHIGSPVAGGVSSTALAFVAYPTAVDTMPAPNLWALMLGATLFTLGIDSAFSLIEATSTVIADTPIGKKMDRMLIALILCVLGAAISTLFCSNWGYTYFDVVDHYLANYLMLLVGILQSFGSCWVWKATEAIEASNKASVWILGLGYWVSILILGTIGNFIDPGMVYDEATLKKDPTLAGVPLLISMIVFWVLLIIVWVVSFVVSKLSFGEWYKKVFLYGASDLAISMSNLSHAPDENPRWVPVFEFWWAFSMKYFFSWAVFWLLMRYFRNDLPYGHIETWYGGYHGFWQWMGFLYPLVGIVCFLVGLMFCTTKEEFDHDAEAAMRGERQKGGAGVSTAGSLNKE